MSVAEAFAHFDANNMFDNALARVRRTIGVRDMPSTISVSEYLDAQGLVTRSTQSENEMPMVAANQPVSHEDYRGNAVGRRRNRRNRRALRS